jgi:hypothetical protein
MVGPSKWCAAIRRAAWARQGQEDVLFFEKKNQKTFASLAARNPIQ